MLIHTEGTLRLVEDALWEVMSAIMIMNVRERLGVLTILAGVLLAGSLVHHALARGLLAVWDDVAGGMSAGVRRSEHR